MVDFGLILRSSDLFLALSTLFHLTFYFRAKEPVLQPKKPLKDKNQPKTKYQEQLKLGLVLSNSIAPP